MLVFEIIDGSFYRNLFVLLFSMMKTCTHACRDKNFKNKHSGLPPQNQNCLKTAFGIE